MIGDPLNDPTVTPRERHRRLVNDLFGAFVLLESAWDESTDDDPRLVEAYPFAESLEEVRAKVQHYADALDDANDRIDLAMGKRLRALHARWTVRDERRGECANMGSGADVVQDVAEILTDHGFPID